MEKKKISLEELYNLLDFPAEVVERLKQVELDEDVRHCGISVC